MSAPVFRAHDRAAVVLGADKVSGIHGANMGFSARAYWRVGGFRALSTGEDVDLVERFEAAGYTISSGYRSVGNHVGANPGSGPTRVCLLPKATGGIGGG